mgnify:CR=1 FL=1
MNVLGADPAEVHSRARARSEALDLRPVALEPPNPCLQPLGQELDLTSDFERTINQRAGDHGAKALDGEGSIDGQSPAPKVAFRRGSVEDGVDPKLQFLEALASSGRNAEHRRASEPGAVQRAGQLLFHEVDIFRFDEVALGDDDEAGRDFQQVEDRQVLARLGASTFVRCDDEKGQVDAARAREHVLDEPFVAGHIDDADFAPGRQREPGKAEVDGEAALLLLAEPVWIDPGQCLDKRALAMVHMPRGADNRHG